MRRSVILGLIVAGASCASAQVPTVRVAEVTLRAFAISAPAPAYPSSAAAKRITGTAVARVHTTAAGRVASVEILQAPSPAIGASVKAAVAGWRFHPALMSGKPVPLVGKLTFYFEIAGGKPIVRSPSPPKRRK